MESAYENDHAGVKQGISSFNTRPETLEQVNPELQQHMSELGNSHNLPYIQITNFIIGRTSVGAGSLTIPDAFGICASQNIRPTSWNTSGHVSISANRTHTGLNRGAELPLDLYNNRMGENLTWTGFILFCMPLCLFILLRIFSGSVTCRIQW